jgi:hypothetical protein
MDSLLFTKRRLLTYRIIYYRSTRDRYNLYMHECDKGVYNDNKSVSGNSGIVL